MVMAIVIIVMIMIVIVIAIMIMVITSKALERSEEVHTTYAKALGFKDFHLMKLYLS